MYRDSDRATRRFGHSFRALKALAAAALVGVTVGFADCYEREHVAYSFVFAVCPNQDPIWADSITSGGVTLKPAKPWRDEPTCAGYKKYTLIQQAKRGERPSVLTPVYVQFVRGDECSVRVVVAFSKRLGQGPAQEAAIAAELVGNSDTTFSGFVRTERTELGAKPEAWCNDTTRRRK